MCRLWVFWSQERACSNLGGTAAQGVTPTSSLLEAVLGQDTRKTSHQTQRFLISSTPKARLPARHLSVTFGNLQKVVHELLLAALGVQCRSVQGLWCLSYLLQPVSRPQRICCRAFMRLKSPQDTANCHCIGSSDDRKGPRPSWDLLWFPLVPALLW